MEFFVAAIVLAALCLGTCVLTIVLGARSEAKSKKIDESVVKSSRGKLKFVRRVGTRTSFKTESYKPADFYAGLWEGTGTVRRDALIIFGGAGFVIFSFVAVGIGMLLWGDLFFGVVVLGFIAFFVGFVAFLHTRDVLRARRGGPRGSDSTDREP